MSDLEDRVEESAPGDVLQGPFVTSGLAGFDSIPDLLYGALEPG
jgi:hypothetical protein